MPNIHGQASEHQHRRPPPSQGIQAAAARWLGLSESTLEKWRLVGCGPPFRKFGRSVAYARADLEAWASINLRTSTSDRGDSTQIA
jgi:hypothetical protein